MSICVTQCSVSGLILKSLCQVHLILSPLQTNMPGRYVESQNIMFTELATQVLIQWVGGPVPGYILKTNQ